MATLLVVLVLILTVGAALAIPMCLPQLSARRYIAISWLPAVALGLEWAFADGLMRALSYAVILLPLATCMLSILLGIVGITLVMRRSVDPRTTLAAATFLASLPGLMLFGYVIYAFVP